MLSFKFGLSFPFLHNLCLWLACRFNYIWSQFQLQLEQKHTFKRTNSNSPQKHTNSGGQLREIHPAESYLFVQIRSVSCLNVATPSCCCPQPPLPNYYHILLLLCPLFKKKISLWLYLYLSSRSKSSSREIKLITHWTLKANTDVFSHILRYIYGSKFTVRELNLLLSLGQTYPGGGLIRTSGWGQWLMINSRDHLRPLVCKDLAEICFLIKDRPSWPLQSI